MCFNGSASGGYELRQTNSDVNVNENFKATSIKFPDISDVCKVPLPLNETYVENVHRISLDHDIFQDVCMSSMKPHISLRFY